MQALLEHGLDLASAIEIADNAGRTPVFEAVDSGCDEAMLRLITKKRSKGGLGAQVNVINYNGQTPLFGAVREGSFESVRVLVEEAGAIVDLTGGEVNREEEDPM